VPSRRGSASRTPERSGRASGRLRIEGQLEQIEKTDGSGDVDFGSGRSLRVSNLAKVYFPEPGITKGMVMRYYARIWPVLQKHVKDRPLVLKRFPEGVGGPLFYQQNAGAKLPHGVRVEQVATSSEGPKARIVGGDLLTLLYTVQLGCIEVHPWLSCVGEIDATDRCLIDLDPGDDVPFATAVKLARNILTIADRCRIPMAVKTSGASGIHLVVPLPGKTTYETSASLALLLARASEAQHPELATTERSIRARPAGTIYVDAMQNARGKSMAGPYSLRPRVNATVSMPLRRSELTSRLRTERFTLGNSAARVMRGNDLWGDALTRVPTAQTIARAIEALGSALIDGTGAVSGAEQRRSRRGGRSAGAEGRTGRRTRSGA
jgi:bifunctional non-homologous end joining protein LigD